MFKDRNKAKRRPVESGHSFNRVADRPDGQVEVSGPSTVPPSNVRQPAQRDAHSGHRPDPSHSSEPQPYYGNYYVEDPRTAPVEDQLVQTLENLWRRKYYILSAIAVGLAICATVLADIADIYVAEAQVQIKTRSRNVLGFDEVDPLLTGNDSEILGEVQKVRSRDIAALVIDQLNLTEQSVPDTSVTIVGRVVGDVVGLFSSGPAESAANSSTNPASDLALSEIVEGFLQNLDANAVGGSNVVSIKYASPDPKLAARVANAVATTYVDGTKRRKTEAARAVADVIRERLGDLQFAVQSSEEAIEQYRATESLIDGVRAPLTTEQISEVNAEIANARAAETVAIARLREVEEYIQTGDIASIADALASPVIQNLRVKEVGIAATRAEVAEAFGIRHPRILALDAELAELRKEIENEVGRIIKNLRNEILIAGAKRAALEGEIAKLEGNAVAASQAGVALRSLERDAEASRTIYELFLGKFKEVSFQDGLEQADAFLISRADVPSRASAPNRKAIFALAFALSAVIGAALGALVDRLGSRGLRHSGEVSRHLGLPTAAMIPLTKGRAERRKLSDQIIRNPDSVYAEAIRALSGAVTLSGRPGESQVILLSSSVPSEGKTTVATSLARSLSESGAKVIIIDCDFRRPGVAPALSLKPARDEPGLRDFLYGRTDTLSSLLDKKSGVRVVTPGKPGPIQPRLLASTQMAGILASLRERYDAIILDTAPIQAAADSRILSGYSDLVLFVIQWHKTRKQVVSNSLSLLRAATSEEKILAVLSQVDLNKHKKFYYGDMATYYAGYKAAKS